MCNYNDVMMTDSSSQCTEDEWKPFGENNSSGGSGYYWRCCSGDLCNAYDEPSVVHTLPSLTPNYGTLQYY